MLSAAVQQEAKPVLLHVLDRSLRLLHPFCPFVTEALWAELNKRSTPGERELSGNQESGIGN